MSNNRFLKWTMGAPEKFEVGMLVFVKGGTMYLIGDIDLDGQFGHEDMGGVKIEEVERWTYLVRDFELQWYSDLAKGK